MTLPQSTEPRSSFPSDLWSEQALASSASWQEALELLCEQGFGGLAEALTILINEAMKLERSAVLGARPFERTPLRRGQANGFKPKTVKTRVGALELRVPQTRDVPFYPSAAREGATQRASPQAGDCGDAGYHAQRGRQGVTTRKVTAVMQELCGLEVTSAQVSRAVQQLDAELKEWRERKLGEVPYVFLDARYEHVRVNGVVVTCALFVAIGVLPSGQRTVLGLSVSLSEAEVHWRDFLAMLQARGLHGVKLFVSDDHAGLTAALATRCAGVKWQRCQFHLGQNLLDHLPPNVSQVEASAELRSVFNAANRQEADRLLDQMVSKYAPVSKKLATWLETNVPQGLTVLDFPREHRPHFDLVELALLKTEGYTNQEVASRWQKT